VPVQVLWETEVKDGTRTLRNLTKEGVGTGRESITLPCRADTYKGKETRKEGWRERASV
jgi:hypothetical protein